MSSYDFDKNCEEMHARHKHWWNSLSDNEKRWHEEKMQKKRENRELENAKDVLSHRGYLYDGEGLRW